MPKLLNLVNFITVIAGGGSAAPVVPPLVTDSFDRADSTGLGTADSGEVWSQSTANLFGISSNQAFRRAAGQGWAYINTDQADVDTTITITIGDSSAHRIIGLARFVDTSNYLVVELIRLTSGGTTIRARRRLANAAATLVTTSTPALSFSTSYTCRLVIVGQNLQLLIDGALVLNTSMSEAEYTAFGSATNIGLYGEETGSRFNDLVVRGATQLPFDQAAASPMTIQYSSTIDAIASPTGLRAKMIWPVGGTDLPILIVMHGYSDAIQSIDDATMARLAAYGVFVAALGMRERDSAGGSKDSGAREIHDIYDFLAEIRSRFSFVSSDRASVMGYSGGGGNVMACAAKFPDSFERLISFFGISSYSAWWTQNSEYREGTNNLNDTIGGDPATVPNAYLARNHVDAAANFSGGQFYLFHDEGDGSVPLSQSENFANTMQGAGLSPYENYTDAGDDPRWEHGYPLGNPDLVEAEPIFMPSVASSNLVWTVPATGTIHVCGYIVTKRFSIWLGTLTEGGAGGGLDEVADVTYNTNTGEYEVTPLTGNMDVFIKQGVLSASASITGVDTLTVS